MEYNNKKSIWKWILLYVIIGAIAYGVIYYFFFYKKGGYSNNNQEASYNNQIETADTSTSLSTESWKTYRNDEYGFEIKYPNNFEIKQSEWCSIIIDGPKNYQVPDIGYPSDDTMCFNIETNPSKLSLLDWFRNKHNKLYTETGRLKIGGQEALILQIVGSSAPTIYLFSDLEESKIYSIDPNGGSLDVVLVKQILSTFKFTK